MALTASVRHPRQTTHTTVLEAQEKKRKEVKRSASKIKSMAALVPDKAAATAADEELNKTRHPWSRIRFSGDEEYVENIRRYRPGGGGYHPVLLGDTFDHGRYRVVHKLGHGGFSTVWLCLDTLPTRPAYVAVKVLVAQKEDREEVCRELRIGRHLQAVCVEKQKQLARDQHFCLPLRDFRLQGPNGTHICIVYPVMGPALASAMEALADEEDCVGTIRRLLRQVAIKLDILHKNGVCHGGLFNLPLS